MNVQSPQTQGQSPHEPQEVLFHSDPHIAVVVQPDGAAELHACLTGFDYFGRNPREIKAIATHLLEACACVEFLNSVSR